MEGENLLNVLSRNRRSRGGRKQLPTIGPSLGLNAGAAGCQKRRAHPLAFRGIQIYIEPRDVGQDGSRFTLP
jgi:hypothetical protein